MPRFKVEVQRMKGSTAKFIGEANEVTLNSGLTDNGEKAKDLALVGFNGTEVTFRYLMKDAGQSIIHITSTLGETNE